MNLNSYSLWYDSINCYPDSALETGWGKGLPEVDGTITKVMKDFQRLR
ncbi:hypothetical protein [Prolixibacter sp. NT017]|nr:hypothetical protein [Prolixibacter sp. NT017]